MGMMSDRLNAPRYAVRLLRAFAFYDIGRSELWRQWGANAVEQDPQSIEFLEQHGAEVERIPLNQNTEERR